MGFFDKVQKPGHTARKQEQYSVHKETVKATAERKRPLFVNHQANKPRAFPGKQSKKLNGVREKDSALVHTQVSRKRGSSSQARLESDSEDDMTDERVEGAIKRARRDSDPEPDSGRQIRSKKAFSAENGGVFPMVHAIEIACLDRPGKFTAAFPDYPQATKIQLQYPSASQKEDYELVIPIQNNDDFKALEDIREVIETIISNYLPPDQAATLTNDSTGLLRRLKRATDRLAGSEYIDYIKEWNDTLIDFRQDGTIAKAIDDWKHIDLKLLERIITQTYSRTVSPDVHELRKYENGTDDVYGELLPRFVSMILKKDTKMKSDQVFVDLGSGVGNCVLQAALEVGCESWGCEQREKASDLAELQAKEFRARCRLWGLSTGAIHLERGDFTINARINEVLKRADLVLVNNQAFTPALNDMLLTLFLDLKDGAKIVSLKSFAPIGQKLTAKNSGAIYNILDVVEKTYYSACVSWADGGGTYYVSTKDSSRVKHFA